MTRRYKMKPGHEQLAEWISRKEMNQSQAAKELGFGKMYISRLVSGKRRPGLTNALILQDRCGIPVASWTLIQVTELENTDSVVVPIRGKSLA